MGYLTNFIVYTLAMIGIIMLALFVFKSATGGCTKSSSKCLKVLDTLSLGARKNLYIVSAGNEKFLIAGDPDRTTLISKLNPSASYEERIPAVISGDNESYSTKSFKDTLSSLPPRKEEFMDKSVIGIKSSQKSPYNSVLKNLATKMQEGVNEDSSETDFKYEIKRDKTNKRITSIEDISSLLNLKGGV